MLFMWGFLIGHRGRVACAGETPHFITWGPQKNQSLRESKGLIIDFELLIQGLKIQWSLWVP